MYVQLERAAGCVLTKSKSYHTIKQLQRQAGACDETFPPSRNSFRRPDKKYFRIMVFE